MAKKMATLFLALAMALPLFACGGAKQTEDVELVVFAAASLEAAFTEMEALYRETAPHVTLTFTFDSSGTLRTQIREGTACDLFVSAGQSQMDDLESGGYDLIDSASRADILENKVVLVVPEGNPQEIETFSDLATSKLSLLCIGNADVPVGSYSLQILENLDIDLVRLEAEGKVTYGSNVTEVANQVKEGVVDCGIVYATDAATYGLTVVDEASEALCGRVVYPAAVVKSGAAPEAAQAFLDYLRTDPAARTVLEGVGFTVLP